MLGQDFFAVGRKYRTVDVWEFTGTWRHVFTQSPALLLEDVDARSELGNAKIRYYALGRIFRLWTWDNAARRWALTEQA